MIRTSHPEPGVKTWERRLHTLRQAKGWLRRSVQIDGCLDVRTERGCSRIFHASWVPCWNDLGPAHSSRLHMARAISSGYNKQAILMCLRERARMSPFQAIKCEVYYCYRFGDSKFGVFFYSPTRMAIRCTSEHVDRFDVNYIAIWVHVAPAHRITQDAVARAHVTKVMIHVRGSEAKNGDIDCPPKEIFVQELLGSVCCRSCLEAVVWAD